MSSISFQGKFIEQARAVVLENISNEQFGVSELADLMSMSRSNLLRKIKKETAASASQFIRQIRLQKGLELLEQTELTVSEISYQVGFGNNSYFIKCFREEYGYPPGEVRKRAIEEVDIEEKQISENKEVQNRFFKKYRWQLLGATSLIVVLVVFLLSNKTLTASKNENVVIKKSIAVLPFKNESSDSDNVYFINGLMESTLNNLQKIKDFRVVSRTSAEKYSSNKWSIPEIAKELNVNYIVEGSGQRIGNQVLLNIQLIEASTDKPIWAQQYNREIGDVFSLQNEIARKIATAVEAVVTPSELAQIKKIPTKNLKAYDFYLQALDSYSTKTNEGLENAISLFKKAIQQDPQFALAYANIAISYYYLDLYQKQKQYTERINNYADKALLYDSKSAESLIAKALYYIQIKEYRLALPHLEKALEYNPNSSEVVQIIADLYSGAIPNTSKYLEYALKGIQLNIAAKDSIEKSYIYLGLSNAFIQNGFKAEGRKYINLSLAYNPQNYYAPYLKIFIQYAEHQNIEKSTEQLVKEWKKDTTRLDIMQEVAKFHYFQEEYDSAFYYYEKFVKIRESENLDIYPQEDIKIAFVYQKKGMNKKASQFFDSFSAYCENNQSIYKSAGLAAKYAYEGKKKQAIEQLKIFATQDNYQYWIVLFLEKDPLMKSLQSQPEYDGIIKKIKSKFWKRQNELKNSLENKGLI